MSAEAKPALRAVGITLDCADPEAQANFWQAAIGFTKREGTGRPYITLSGAPGDRVINHLTLQRVPEPKSVKHRLHLDLFVGDAEAETARLVALGATVIGRDTGGSSTVIDSGTDGGAAAPSGGHLGFEATVMADPEGGEFCIVSRPKRPTSDS